MATTKKNKSSSAGRKKELFVTINALFTMLEAAYPTKFKLAFPTDDLLIEAKKVWMTSLQEFSPQRIKNAVKRAIDTVDFFPDLGDIRRLCKLNYQEIGLKEPLQAYYEACQSSCQSRTKHWSHIVVYLAARETGWMTLRSEEQRIAFPLFERNYEILCNRVLDGEDPEAELLKGIENHQLRSATDQAEGVARQAQNKLMEQQGINPDDADKARQALRKTFHIKG
ncbi:hypothetical protein CI610_00615 [invertebrate metagenome]|uniref:Uncharacterized protein n=1 Tax=invertebrate metagenome TaxID=1711999 RepID=A0A2H9TAY4_9ZZZZ